MRNLSRGKKLQVVSHKGQIKRVVSPEQMKKSKKYRENQDIHLDFYLCFAWFKNKKM